MAQVLKTGACSSANTFGVSSAPLGSCALRSLQLLSSGIILVREALAPLTVKHLPEVT